MESKTHVEQIKMHGFDKIPEIIIPSTNLLQIEELISSTTNSTVIPKKENLRRVLSYSQEFLSQHFTLRDVPFYKETIIGPLRIEKSGTVHPFGLPVTQIKNEDSFYGNLNEVVTLSDGVIIDYQYRGIELSKHTTSLSSLAYTHEITHSQLNHVKDQVKDYTNTEFLSIFLETLQAYQTSDKLLRIHDSERLLELAGIIKELRKYHSTTDESIKDILIEGTSYAKSTLKAYSLFIKYYNSKPQVQKIILQDIQRIFNQEISVEDFLSLYDITFEESQDVTRLTNYLKR